MSLPSSSKSPSKLVRYVSYVLSAAPVLLMILSGVMKLLHPPMIVEGFAKNGVHVGTIVAIGLVELMCVVLYVLPKTAVLGAILMTGYLGGAVYVHVQAGEANLVMPVLLGMCAWGGLYLRDQRVAALIPLRALNE